MINSIDLKDNIKMRMLQLTPAELSSSLACHNKYANAVVEYLLPNIEIVGTYSGTISGGLLPDPLNGVYKWNPVSISLTGSALKLAAGVPQPGDALTPWILALGLGLGTTTFLGQDNDNSPKITTSAPALCSAINLPLNLSSVSIKALHSGMTPQQLQVADLFDITHGHIADMIKVAYVATVVVPNSVPAVSLSPGSSGTVTFTVIS